MQDEVSRPGQSDESKIIDLHQLRAVVESGPGAAESAVALPTFGPDRLNPSRPLLPPSLSPAERLISAPIAEVTAVPPRTAPDARLLVSVVCMLAAVVVGLAYYVIISDPGQTIVREQVVAVAPSVAAIEAPKRERRGTAAAALIAEPADDAQGESTPTDPEPAEVTPESEISAQPRRRSGRSRGNAKRPQRSDAAPSPSAATPRPKAQGGSKRDASVSPECVIDPASCGLGAPRDTTPRPTKATTDLPEKLGESALRQGMAKVKAKAKACRAQFGGSAGEKVEVKLTISGSTGRVTKAAPIGSHAGTPLGGCVAAALKRAEFARFGASVQGVRYGVRL